MAFPSSALGSFLSAFLLCCTGCTGSPNPGSGTTAASALSALEALPAEGQQVIRDTELPVLLFPAIHGPQTQAMVGPHFLALNTPAGEVTLMLHIGNVVHHALPEGATVPPAPLTVRGRPARTTVNDGIRSLTWAERGAHFSLEIECHHLPLEDPRCMETDFILELAAQLEEVQ